MAPLCKNPPVTLYLIAKISLSVSVSPYSASLYSLHGSFRSSHIDLPSVTKTPQYLLHCGLYIILWDVIPGLLCFLHQMSS